MIIFISHCLTYLITISILPSLAILALLLSLLFCSCLFALYPLALTLSFLLFHYSFCPLTLTVSFCYSIACVCSLSYSPHCFNFHSLPFEHILSSLVAMLQLCCSLFCSHLLISFVCFLLSITFSNYSFFALKLFILCSQTIHLLALFIAFLFCIY